MGIHGKSYQYPRVPNEKWEFAQFLLNMACSASNFSVAGKGGLVILVLS